jgi:hypothetical protein
VTDAPPLRLGRGLAGAALIALWVISVVRPPAPTGAGLDESWRIGLTLATLEHLQFGRDVVFTFGPLGYVLQGIADPALAAPAAAIALGLAALTGAAVWFVLRGRASVVQKTALGVALLALGTQYSFDFVVLAGILALLARAARFPRLAAPAGAMIGAVALFGLLSKFTLGIDVLAAAGAVWAIDLVRGPARRRRATLLAAALALGIAGGGTLAAFGFDPGAAGAYARTGAELLSGYSAAMAIPGPRIEILAALLLGAAIVAVALFAWREGRPTALGIAAVTLFATWKYGFVRQDGHVLAFFYTAAVLAPLVGTMVRKRTAAWAAAAVSATALGALGWIVVRTDHVLPPLFEPARIAQGAAFVAHPQAVAAAVARASETALAADRLAPALRRRIGDATADVLPVETALAKANALRWTPLPVFQTYVAYTTALDEMNRHELVRAGARYVLYRYEAIDLRLPFGDMPATTAELLCRYRVADADAPTAGSGAFMLLERSAGASCAAMPAGRAEQPAIGRPVTVPRAARGAFVTAAFVLRPTLVTRAAALLWRPPLVFFEITYDDGAVTRRRAVTGTIGDGVVVSVAPRDEAEAARFFGGADIRAVRSVALLTRPGAYVLDGVTFTQLRRTRAGARTP